MFEEITNQLRLQIKDRIEKLAIQLMNNDNKNFCHAGFAEQDWVLITIPFGDEQRQFILLPSPIFKHQIFDRQYLKAVGSYPELFGTGKVEDVLTALKEIDSKIFPPDYSLNQFYEYLKEENMAYIIEITNGTLGHQILRLDLFRGIDKGDYRGGIFHALKHFTIEDYGSISMANKGAFTLAHWNYILLFIIKNFFSGLHISKSTGRLFAVSELSNNRVLVGGYFAKNEIDGLYYLNTLQPKSIDSINSEEKQIIVTNRNGTI